MIDQSAMCRALLKRRSGRSGHVCRWHIDLQIELGCFRTRFDRDPRALPLHLTTTVPRTEL
jgi:hypothetical protein